MPATMADYTTSSEWKEAERAMANMLGFRVTRLPGAVERKGQVSELRHPDNFQLQNVDDNLKIIAVQPTIRATYALWCEAVRQRIDSQSACGLAWRLYAAATGLTISTFNGMPPGEPEEHLKRLRNDYIKQERELDAALERARAQLAAAGLCWQCAPPHRETVGMRCSECGTDYGVAEDGHAPLTP